MDPSLLSAPLGVWYATLLGQPGRMHVRNRREAAFEQKHPSTAKQVSAVRDHILKAKVMNLTAKSRIIYKCISVGVGMALTGQITQVCFGRGSAGKTPPDMFGKLFLFTAISENHPSKSPTRRQSDPKVSPNMSENAPKVRGPLVEVLEPSQG